MAGSRHGSDIVPQVQLLFSRSVGGVLPSARKSAALCRLRWENRCGVPPSWRLAAARYQAIARAADIVLGMPTEEDHALRDQPHPFAVAQVRLLASRGWATSVPPVRLGYNSLTQSLVVAMTMSPTTAATIRIPITIFAWECGSMVTLVGCLGGACGAGVDWNSSRSEAIALAMSAAAGRSAGVSK